MGQDRGNRAAREPQVRSEVPKTKEEQDKAIRGLAEFELAGPPGTR